MLHFEGATFTLSVLFTQTSVYNKPIILQNMSTQRCEQRSSNQYNDMDIQDGNMNYVNFFYEHHQSCPAAGSAWREKQTTPSCLVVGILRIRRAWRLLHARAGNPPSIHLLPLRPAERERERERERVCVCV